MSAQPPLLDLERFNMIGVGNDPIVMKIFRHFLALLPRSIDGIRSAYDTGDWETFRQRVHRLKGASITCCFLELADCLAEWEDAAGGPDDFDFSRLSELARRSAEAMERLLRA